MAGPLECASDAPAYLQVVQPGLPVRLEHYVPLHPHPATAHTRGPVALTSSILGKGLLNIGPLLLPMHSEAHMTHDQASLHVIGQQSSATTSAS